MQSKLYYGLISILIPLQIDFLVGRPVELGKVYKGVIASIKEYGAFVEFSGGKQGLLHKSELSHNPVIDSIVIIYYS